MRRFTWFLLVLPWLGMVPPQGGKKGNVAAPRLDPSVGSQRATGAPIRGRVLVPTPDGGVVFEDGGGDCGVCGRVWFDCVDEEWLEDLDRRLARDLRLLVDLLGGEDLRPKLARFFKSQRGLTAADRIDAKEELFFELLELARE